jgi:molybdate transport system substrate-binding protein
MSGKLLAVAVFGVFMLTAASASTQAVEVKALSAIGLHEVMLELGPKFESATGYRLAITFGGTVGIAQRVTSGEQVDAVMINRSFVENLEKAGRVTAGSVTHIARSVVAVAVRKGAPKPDISSPEAFKHMLLVAKSVARPPAAGGSSGSHIAEVLERLGITVEVNAKSVISTAPQGQLPELPGEAVAAGKAEIALHQLQELMTVPGIEIVGPFPGELQGSFEFSAAIGAHAKQIEAAKALIAFLRTPEAVRVIRAKGMEPITP